MRNNHFEFNGQIKVNNNVQDNELGFTKFIKNTGMSLYRCYDNDFNNWSKLEINNAGQKTATPCN